MNEVLIIVIGLVIALKLVHSLSRPRYAIKILIALFAYLQLCLGPYLYYTFYQGTELSLLWNLEMAVDADLYFSYLLPGLSAFIFGLFFAHKNLNDDFKFRATGEEQVKPLIVIGLTCSLILNFSVPQSLSFLLILGGSLAKCGLLIIHFQRIRNASKVVELITIPALLLISLLFYEASVSGMFEAMVFWIFILLVTSLAHIPKSIFRNLTILVSGILVIISMQTAKGIYRTLIWNDGVESNLEIFGSSLYAGYRTSQENFNDHVFWFPLAERLNQGRIVSHVIQKIETDEINLDFNRIPIAFASSFVPRLLWPSKPVAGGRDNISRYTDIPLVGATSMNISHFGDFFIALGRIGGIFSLFFWGAIMSWFINWTTSERRNKYMLWLSPIVLIGLIPIETDLNMVLNHFVKSTVFIFFISNLLGQNR